MKKDTHGVFICITPNWNFPLKNLAPASFAARRKPPYLCGTTQNRRKKTKNQFQIIALLLGPGTSVFWDSMSYKQKRRQKKYWSSSCICVCMSCSLRFHPDTIVLHMENLHWVEQGHQHQGQEISVLVRRFSGTRGVLPELPKVEGREERPSSTEEQWIKVLPQDNTAWQEARGDAGRRE